MFDKIAPTYDSANRILSLGIDVAWRKEACKKAFEFARCEGGAMILDVACGTGDMIIHWRKNATKFGKPIKKIIGIDPSEGMLEVAKKKLENYLCDQKSKNKEPNDGESPAQKSNDEKSCDKKVELYLGEAKNLHMIDSGSMDIISIAYGLRNVVDVSEALNEFGRVLKKDGILVVLEFTKKEKENFLDKITGIYTKKILPLIGGLVSRNYKAYRYLPDSIGGFLSARKLKEELNKVGIETRFIKSYSAGISTLLIGIKR
ncbi:hypothetical protein BJI48_02565 [Helicobacter sp. 11S02596-1]|nr:hypothetical protein BJI48_02565 [Helicobacter sp. 11S02596-1]